MRRLAIPVLIAATLVLATALFQFKQTVGDLERELAQVNAAIVDHQETIQILRSEWSFLNQPSTVEQLAKRHLHMQPSTAARVIRLEDLPWRDGAAQQIAATAAAQRKTQDAKGNSQ